MAKKIKRALLHQIGTFLGLVIVVSISSIFGAILVNRVIAAPAGEGSISTRIGPAAQGPASTLFAGQQMIYDQVSSGGDCVSMVAYKPSDNVLYSDTSVSGTGSTSWVLKKGVKLENVFSSQFRIKFSLAQSHGNANAVHARIYKSGVPWGTERSMTGGSTPIEYIEDLYFDSGDYIQIYAYTESRWVTAKVSNFSVNGSLDGSGHFWYPYP